MRKIRDEPPSLPASGLTAAAVLISAAGSSGNPGQTRNPFKKLHININNNIKTKNLHSMKKFTLLMTLFLAFAGIGTMQAQQPFEVSDEPTDNQYATTTKWYTIKNKNNQYFATGSNYVDANGNLKLVATKPTDITGYWCLTGNETDGYQLHNAAFPAGMVLGTTGDGDDGGNARCNLYYADETNTDVTTRYDIVVSNETNRFNIILHGSKNHGFNYRNGYLALWNSDGIRSDDNSKYTFEEVTDNVIPEIQKLRINYVINDSHTGYSWTSAKIAANNSTVEKPELSYFYGDASFTNANTTVTPDNHNFTLNVSSETAPFQFSTPESPKWYTMYTRNNEQYVVRESNTHIETGGNGGRTSPFTTTYINNFDKFNGAMWAFVQDGGGLKLYNKAGQNYVTTTGGDATLTDNGTTFIVEKTGYAGGTFALHMNGRENAYLGSHSSFNGLANHQLGIWETSLAKDNGGSAFTIATIDDTPDALNIAIGLLEALFPYDPVNIGGYGEGAASEAKAAAEALEAKTVENVLNLASTFKPTAIREVKEGEYYRIIFKRGMAAMTNMYALRTTLQGNNTLEVVEASVKRAYAAADGEIAADDTSNEQRTVVVQPNTSDNDISAIWKFKKISDEEGAYQIINVNSGLTLGTPSTDDDLRLVAKGNESYMGHYKIVHNSANTKEMAFEVNNVEGNKKNLNTYLNGTQNYGRGFTLWKNGTDDTGNVVLIKQVTEIPVSISAAGYSTLCLPFAVTIPTTSSADGVKAYIVTGVNAGNELVMEAITGVIPAGEAVILEGTEGTYNFAITTGGEKSAGNLLTGTTLERHGMPAGEYYGLGNKAEGVAFYVANSEEMPANKAFLLKSSIPAGASLQANALTFFGETTGVGSVKTDATDADNTYYDLNGRRVAYPSRGIYVKGNGQKVFIK